ncbi:hypothetical protein [Paenibacillus sp. R14(2021)]|uniref:hypothetical protein n=1 Tax=Paenibacillus sp. R14(2021) TaxID=2859228 RepID=UPI001C612748|nr:hypothetical protein [Paenibacillus sp. R14(2021)]
MPIEAACVLEIILCGFGMSPFKEEQLLQAVRPGRAGADLRVGLLQLAEAGIVFAVRRGWGEKLFVLPADSFFVWHAAMVNERQQPISVAGTDTTVDPLTVCAIDHGGYVPLFSLQLVHAMAQLAQSGFKRTRGGTLTKRAQLKALEQLSVSEEALRELGGIEASADEENEGTPLPLLLLLYTAYRERWLIDRQPAAYELNPETWLSWLDQYPAARENQLLKELLGLVCSHNSSAAVGAAVLLHFPYGQWHRCLTIEHLFIGTQEVLVKPQRSTIRAWCVLLKQLGWLELAADDRGNTVMRWLIDPLQPDQAPEAVDEDCWPGAAQMTPDGDIYVHHFCPYRIRWQLESIADRRRTDHISVYHMDAGSFKRAAKMYDSAGQITALLEAFIEEPLPETMARMIESSMKPYLHSAEAAFTITLEGTDPLQQPVLPMTPARGRLSQASYELLQERVSVKQLFTGLEEVPVMWLKQFRAYHHSTRRELLEQALIWRTSVKLNCEGGVTAFVPERIVDDQGRWAVIGYREVHSNRQTPEPVMLFPEMWQEMMILLPSHIGTI